MIFDIWLILGKDLRIERSSKVIFSQVLPFSLLILILFGMAISSDLIVEGENQRTVLEQIAPGLFWLAILFSSLLTVSRSFAIEAADGNLEALRMTGIDPSAIFLGKSIAVFVQLILLEMVVGLASYFIYDVSLRHVLLLFSTVALATLAIACAGTLYAAVASGARTRDTLLPLLLLPTLAPVLLVATQSTESSLFGGTEVGWGWTMLLGVFALLYLSVGMLSFESLMEES